VESVEALLKTCHRISLLRVYGFVTGFVKHCVVGVEPLLIYFSDEIN